MNTDTITHRAVRLDEAIDAEFLFGLEITPSDCLTEIQLNKNRNTPENLPKQNKNRIFALANSCIDLE